MWLLAERTPYTQQQNVDLHWKTAFNQAVLLIYLVRGVSRVVSERDTRLAHDD